MPSPEKVEMRCAYEWTCPNCGTDHFQRAVIMEMTAEDVADLRERYGGDNEDWQSGHWMTRPDQVECPECGDEFETEDVDMPRRG